MRHIGRGLFKALRLSTIRIAALVAFAAGAAIIMPLAPAGLKAAGAPASKPGAAAGPGESLILEVLGAGLEGYVDHSQPARIHYRIYNSGPPRKIMLGLEQITEGEGTVPGKILENYGGFRRLFEMPAGVAREGRWIMPRIWASRTRETRTMLVARDLDGKTVARADLPDLKFGFPVLILVREPGDAASIQTALLLYVPGKEWSDSSVTRRDVTVAAGRAPANWHEYIPAKMVILARRWAELNSAQRKALTRWVSIGGRLIVSPGSCPDWRTAPWGGLAKTGGRYGTGEIYVIPEGLERGSKGGIDEKSLGGWFATTELLTWDSEFPPPHARWTGFALTRSYALPGMWLLAFFIFAIVLLVGLIPHLVLAKAGRREWVWVVVPGLSLLLALVAYGVASGVKDERTVLEVRHLVRIFEGVPEAAVATSTRVLSSRKQEFSVRLSAEDPIRSNLWYLSDDRIVAEDIRRDGIDLPGILMQRFHIKDFSFTSFAGNPPSAGIHLSGDGAVVENTGAGELRDIFLYTRAGWIAVAPVLRQGQKAVAGPLTKAVGASELKPGWQVEGGMKQFERTLDSAVSWGQLTVPAIVLVARCGSSGFPSLTLEPAPDLVFQSAVCVWLKQVHKGFGYKE